MRPSGLVKPLSVPFPAQMAYSRDAGAIDMEGCWSWDHSKQQIPGCAAPGKRSACGLSSSSPTRSHAPEPTSGYASTSPPAPSAAGNPTRRHGRIPTIKPPWKPSSNDRSQTLASPRHGPAASPIPRRASRRWKPDTPPCPHPDHQAALEALFQRPVADLGFTPPWASGQPDTPPGPGPVSPAITASSAAGPVTMFPQRLPAATLPASIASDYISITSAHRHMYWSVPPAHLHDAVAAHVQLGVRLVTTVPDAARRALAAAVSESSLLAGRIEFFDLQHPIPAQASLVTALQAAQDAQDILLGSAVLAHMAFIPAFSGDRKRADQARDKIRAARAFARRGPASPEMLAWLDAVEAEVETRFGDTRKALQLINHPQAIFATEERP